MYIITTSPPKGSGALVGNKAAFRRMLPDLRIPDSQIGGKWGTHAPDYGYRPENRQAMQWYRERARTVHNNPDEVRQGPWHPDGGG